MAVLKRKTSSGWTTVAPPFPTQIEKHVTEIEPNFTTLNATSNDEYTPQSPYNGFSAAMVNVTGGVPSVIRAGDTPVILTHGAYRATTTLAASGIKLKIPRAGQYRIYWGVSDGDGSSYKVTSRLYVNDSGVGTERTTTSLEMYYEDLDLDVDDKVEIWIKGYSYSGTYGTAHNLCACIDWGIWGD